MLTIENYPFYKLKIPSDKEQLIKVIRKIALYWEKFNVAEKKYGYVFIKIKI